MIISWSLQLSCLRVDLSVGRILYGANIAWAAVGTVRRKYPSGSGQKLRGLPKGVQI